MPDPELTRVALAVLIQAPFTFRLGFAVRDGREWLFGGMFLVLGGSVAAVGGFLSGSLLVGVGAALAAVFVLAYARLPGVRRTSAPPPAATQAVSPVPAAPPAPAVAPAPPAADPAADPFPPPHPLLTGIAFLTEVLRAADELGELRYRRRLRKLQRQQAERQARSGRPGVPPQRYLRVRAKRDPLRLPWK